MATTPSFPGTLTEHGQLFLAHARTLHGDPLSDIDLSVDGGHFDDLTFPIVRLVSVLSYSERARRFGMTCLPSSRAFSGRSGPQGDPIPTEEWIAKIITCYGDSPERRSIALEPYASRVRRGYITLADAINAAGEDLHLLLTAGAYRLQEEPQS